jgi:competence protein ComEA
MVAVVAVVVSALGFFRNEGTVVAPSAVSVVDGGGSSGPGTLPVLDNSDPQPGQGMGLPADEATAPASPPVAVDIVVAVTGAVRQPGIVTLPVGSRVADAIAAAGGVLDGTDYTGLNLAAKLADGDSVVVGGSGQGLRSTGSATGPAAASAAATPDLIDLNAADEAALESLPGVGPVMAGNIIAWRESNGGFRSVDQLQEITGIGPARFATLAPLVRVG